MKSKSKSLLKNLGILTISNFASKILVFLLVPLYTSVLTTTEYGIYDLIVSTITLLVPLLSLNINDAVMRFMMDKNYSKNAVAFIGIRYISYSISIVGIFLFVLNCLGIWREIEGLEIYIFTYYLFYVLDQYLIQLAKGLDQIIDMGVAGVLGTFIMIAANILFLVFFKCGLLGFLTANILSQVIPAIYLSFRLNLVKIINNLQVDKKLEKEMLTYCIPLIATVVGWWINSGSDKYIVTFFCGIATNGILSVSYKIPSILNTLQGIFIQAWQISAIKEYGKKDTAIFYGYMFSFTDILMCMACSWLIILAKPLAHILYAKDFYIAWEFVPFLLLSSVMNCASGFLGPILSAKKDSKSMAMSAVFGAGVNFFLNILFVYFIGAQGVTIATFISSYIIYQVRKSAVENDIKIERYGVIVLTWMLLSVQAIIEICTELWYLELVFMMGMFCLNSGRIKNLFKMIMHINER